MKKIQDRKVQVLKYIVEEYLKTGEIMGSKNLLKKYDLQVSVRLCATIWRPSKTWDSYFNRTTLRAVSRPIGDSGFLSTIWWRRCQASLSRQSRLSVQNKSRIDFMMSSTGSPRSVWPRRQERSRSPVSHHSGHPTILASRIISSGIMEPSVRRCIRWSSVWRTSTNSSTISSPWISRVEFLLLIPIRKCIPRAWLQYDDREKNRIGWIHRLSRDTRLYDDGLCVQYHGIETGAIVDTVTGTDTERNVINFIWHHTIDNLNLGKRAYALNRELHILLKQFPKEEQFALTDQIRRAWISIISNIAEWHGRPTNADYNHFMNIAKWSAMENRDANITSKRLLIYYWISRRDDTITYLRDYSDALRYAKKIIPMCICNCICIFFICFFLFLLYTPSVFTRVFSGFDNFNLNTWAPTIWITRKVSWSSSQQRKVTLDLQSWSCYPHISYRDSEVSPRDTQAR